MLMLLSGLVQARMNVIVSGATGTGKTTLLNALSALIPDGERIITIEDSAELQLQQPHVIRLESRPANVEGKGRITIRDLVRNSLRMRPDRIIVGEVRGGETLDMLQAMSTGHDGSLATVHANSAEDALMRLQTLGSMSEVLIPFEALKDQINSAVDVVVQLTRFADGSRKVTEIALLVSHGREQFRIATVSRFAPDPLGADRVVHGRFEPAGRGLEELRLGRGRRGLDRVATDVGHAAGVGAVRERRRGRGLRRPSRRYRTRLPATTARLLAGHVDGPAIHPRTESHRHVESSSRSYARQLAQQDSHRRARSRVRRHPFGHVQDGRARRDDSERHRVRSDRRRRQFRWWIHRLSGRTGSAPGHAIRS